MYGVCGFMPIGGIRPIGKIASYIFLGGIFILQVYYNKSLLTNLEL